MAASKNTTDDRITVAGTLDSATIVTDIADTAWCETLESDSGTEVYLFKKPLEIEETAVWEDNGCIVLHTHNDSDDAIVFLGNGGGRITFGVTNPFTQTGASDDEPITVTRSGTDASFVSACLYSFVSNNSSQTWSSGGGGTFQMHGGMMMFRDDSPDADNDLYAIIFPNDTNIIQCNIEHNGGITFDGYNYRVQESTIKSSNNEGVKFTGSTTKRFQDIIFHDMIVAFDLGSDGYDNSFNRIQFRGCTNNITYSGYSGTFELIDSDNLSVDGGVESGSTLGTDGYIFERNSVNVSFVDDGGTNLTDVRALVYQTSSEGSVTYGPEMITTYPEQLADRNTRNNANPITPISAGNFSVRGRRYDSLSIDIAFVPANRGFVEKFVMLDDPFTVLSEAAAAAITGVVIDRDNKELDLSGRSTPITPSELYDHLHAVLDDDGYMDIPELFRTKDGTNYIMPTSWDLVSQQNLDLSGGETVTNRYVPITITGLIQDAECAVIQDPLGTPTVIGSGTVAAAQTSITLTTTFTAGATIAVRARLLGRKPFTTLATISAAGATFDATSQFVDDEAI